MFIPEFRDGNLKCRFPDILYVSLNDLLLHNFHIHTLHHDTIKVFFYLPTDAQLDCH
jgi:hypothetical protein